MTYEHYRKAIEKVTETTGKPSILVVDGLSMMGGKGTETEVYSRNSADLKELANEENIFIILICHVSKGAEKHTRDLSRNIRGSEKILDNCDFYMTMSQIQDLSNPETYVQDKGFISFYDKRGSGKTVDLLFNFDPKRLWLLNSPEDPKQYYEPVRTRGAKQEIDF
jgi:replicative DNA helicase